MSIRHHLLSHIFVGGLKKKYPNEKWSIGLEIWYGSRYWYVGMKYKRKIGIGCHLINYSWFVKTGLLVLKFGIETKFHLEKIMVSNESRMTDAHSRKYKI